MSMPDASIFGSRLWHSVGPEEIAARSKQHVFLRNSHVAAGALSSHRDVAERTKSMQLYSTGILVKGHTTLSQTAEDSRRSPGEKTRGGVPERNFLSRSGHAEVWVAVRVALRFAEELPGIPHRLALEPDPSVSS